MWQAQVFTLYPDVFPGPLSKGLFHKAIGQSGARLIPLTHLNKRTSYSKSAEKIGLELSAVMSGNNNSTLEDLKKIPALTIIENRPVAYIIKLQ